jgi:hypothetical protein
MARSQRPERMIVEPTPSHDGTLTVAAYREMNDDEDPRPLWPTVFTNDTRSCQGGSRPPRR